MKIGVAKARLADGVPSLPSGARKAAGRQRGIAVLRPAGRKPQLRPAGRKQPQPRLPLLAVVWKISHKQGWARLPRERFCGSKFCGHQSRLHQIAPGYTR